MKPPRLREGDTVGVISPSWGGGAAYPHRVERGVEHLKSLGFRVRIAPHALNSAGYVSDTAENRAADIHEVILERTRGYDFPVVADMDFGHTSPMFTLPVGCRALIDARREQFEIIEAVVT